MKKIIALMLAVLFAFSVCACSSKVETADVSAKDLIAAVMNSAQPENADTLSGADDADFMNKFEFYYGIGTDSVRDCAIAYSSSAFSDEISVLVAAEGTDVKELVQALETRREQQRQTFELYSPESVELLKNAEIFSMGDYAVMIVAADAAGTKEKLTALLTDADAVAEQSAQYYELMQQASAYDYSQPVPEADKVSEDWFSDAAFIGDSRMKGILNFSDFDYAAEFAYVGLNVADVFTKPYVETKNGSVSVSDALANDAEYGRIYVMLGINELGWSSIDKFVDYYGKIVDLLRQTHPEAQIYIISILPVGSQATAGQPHLNNDRVAEFNGRILEMCTQKQVYYVNGFEALEQDGKLPDDGSPDGVHMEPKYCHMLTDYLLTHTVAQE